MATIYDVAKQAGVSVATVSAVINDSAYVSPGLRSRVEAAVTALNYNPNLLARSLAQNKTFTVGILIPDITNPFYPEVVRGAEDKGKQAGYTLLLGNSDNQAEKEEVYLRLFLSKRVDGILLIKGSEDLDQSFLAKLQGGETPVVLVGRRYPQLQTDCVVADDAGGAYAAVRHLAQLGHKRIGIITGPRNVSTSQSRLAGYAKALAGSKLPYVEELVEEGDYGMESGLTAGVQLLAQRPTAVFITNYLMTVGFMNALEKQRLGCPQDVAVVSYDDFLWSQFFHPKLTCIEQPKYELGFKAMELLLSRLRGRHKKPKLVVLKNKLNIRESCGQKSS